MAIDRFALCPGGTGKKIKFCHSECVGFLEKIQKLMESEQLRAALQLVDQTLARDPNRACVWSFKCLLERATGDVEQFAKAAEEFSRRFPKSPIALAEQSLSHIIRGNVTEAITFLGQSIDASSEQRMLYTRQAVAAVTIGETLADYGHIPAATEILTIFLSLMGEQDSPLKELATELATSREVLEIREMQWDGLFATDRYRQLLEVCDHLAAHLRWQELENHLKEYLNREPEDARVWHYLGVVQMWLMNYQAAGESFARAGELEKNDRLSVFSLSRAVLFSPILGSGDKFRNVTVVVDDPNRLKEAILSDRRVLARKLDVDKYRQMFSGQDDEPVLPELALAVLRRPLPDGESEGARLYAEIGEMPVIAYARYYGRQTDRPARLVFEDALESELEWLKELVKGWLGSDTIEWSVDPNVNEKLPVVKLFSDATRICLLEPSISFEAEWASLIGKWLPAMTFKCLGDKSLAEAAKDPQKRRWVMALLISLKSRFGIRSVVDPVDELWQQFGLGLEDDLTLDAKLFRRIPLSLVRVLDVPKLPPKFLGGFYSLAKQYEETYLLQQLAHEVLRRKDDAEIPPELVRSAYLELMEGLLDPANRSSLEQLTELVKEGIAFLEKHNLPHGMLHAADFHVALARTDQNAVTSVIEHILREHENEKDITQFIRGFLALAAQMTPPEEEKKGKVLAEADGVDIFFTPKDSTAGGAPKKIWIPGAD